MMKAILLVLVISMAFLMGCVGPNQPAINESIPHSNTTYNEQPVGIPMPNDTELNDSEPPKFPF